MRGERRTALGTTASLTKDGAGTLTLTGQNTFTGVTTVNAGTLKLGTRDGVGSSSALTVARGATFDRAGFNSSRRQQRIATAGQATAA